MNVIHYGEGREKAFTALMNTVNVQSKILVYTSSSKYRYMTYLPAVKVCIITKARYYNS
jgi:hypothetical protein